MNNFHDYILKDIEEKKALLEVFPINTALRREKMIDTLNDLKNKFSKSRADLKKYIIYQYETILPKKTIYNVDIEQKEIEELKKMLTPGNPKTTFFEQMGFDMILYKLMHYYNISISDINKLLKSYLSKFNDVGVKLSEKDFKINPYLYTYMAYFFKDDGTVNKEIYEKIYWKCPKIYEYLLVTLRVLTLKYSKKFTKYINSEFKKTLEKNGFKSFDDVINKIKELSIKIDNTKEEDEYDIVHLCMDEKIDIKDFIDSEEDDFAYFTIEEIDIHDENKVNQTIAAIRNLRHNLEEYNIYLKYADIIVDEFKADFSSYVNNPEKKNTILKDKEKEINKSIKGLWKKSVKKYYPTIEQIEAAMDKKSSDILFEQDQLLADAYEKVKEYNELYFKEKCKEIVKPNTTAGEILEVIYSYPFFAFKKFGKLVQEVEDDSEIMNRLNEVRDLIFNPYRKLIDIIQIFSNQNVLQVLTNGYRFENLNLYEDSFDAGNIELIFDKCDKVIRRVKMDKFNLNIDQIKFLSEVNKLKNSNQI